MCACRKIRLCGRARISRWWPFSSFSVFSGEIYLDPPTWCHRPIRHQLWWKLSFGLVRSMLDVAGHGHEFGVEVDKRLVVVSQHDQSRFSSRASIETQHTSLSTNSSSIRVLYYWSRTFVWQGDAKDGHISRISNSFQSLQEVQLALGYFRNRLRTRQVNLPGGWKTDAEFPIVHQH